MGAEGERREGSGGRRGVCFSLSFLMAKALFGGGTHKVGGYQTPALSPTAGLGLLRDSGSAPDPAPPQVCSTAGPAAGTPRGQGTELRQGFLSLSQPVEAPLHRALVLPAFCDAKRENFLRPLPMESRCLKQPGCRFLPSFYSGNFKEMLLCLSDTLEAAVSDLYS